MIRADMQRRQILINSIMSVLQILTISVVLFFLYKFLLGTIGAEKFGIWSLVLAATAVTQIADLGLSGGVVKFVAKYIAREENENVIGVIQTAALTIGATVGLILTAGYPVIKWALRLIVPSESFPLALEILPFAFIALWLCMLTSIFQAGLDGYQRFDVRSLILISGAVFHFLLCIWWVPKHGLLGLAYAKVVQNGSVMIVSRLALKKIVPSLPFLPFGWNKRLFKEMIGYSINFQIISVSNMLYDPITKALLSKFGGLSMVGYYQMAGKMIQRLHSLIIAANQVLVPAIADLKEKTPEKIRHVYITSYRLLFYLVFPLYFLVIISLPLISKIWIGHYEGAFVTFSALLSIGWLLNTLSSPAYHTNLGTGKLFWNVVGHIVIAVLNVGLGIVLGFIYAGTGVVFGWMLSLALGSSIIYFSYHIRYKIPLSALVPEESRMTLSVCLVGLLFLIAIHKVWGEMFPPTAFSAISVFVFMGIISIPYWRHPMRKRLYNWVAQELFKRK